MENSLLSNVNVPPQMPKSVQLIRNMTTTVHIKQKRTGHCHFTKQAFEG